MKKVSVASLKQELSSYLHLVEKGEEVVVTSHNRPVARIVPELEGVVVREPRAKYGSLKQVKGVSLSRGVSAFDALIEDRRKR
ncbi:MAG: type II toxin-antitoxin system prevent-host-death family antitoxin [Verrucomicrobia bacterium]|nr:type II toxin-antitoxin system prevent-host-death family antitoxin [Verrucomicrobiota bacterium]